VVSRVQNNNVFERSESTRVLLNAIKTCFVLPNLAKLIFGQEKLAKSKINFLNLIQVMAGL
jgi:hypothetical protein